ncbi:MAG: hypothetical protein WC761_04235 [Candidatus Paceibacterota bacterium]|jgi:hypothetical protein
METMNTDPKPEGDSKEEYTFGNDGYIYLSSLTIENLPTKLNISGYELSAKDEFHCSLVCTKDLKDKYGEDIEKRIVDLFKEFTLKNKVAFTGYRNDFRLVKRGERVSVMVMCDISYLDSFFRLMKEELEIEADTQPAHVTIYTLQPNAGIGVNTHLALEATEKIEVPDEVRTALHL